MGSWVSLAVSSSSSATVEHSRAASSGFTELVLRESISLTAGLGLGLGTSIIIPGRRPAVCDGGHDIFVFNYYRELLIVCLFKCLAPSRWSNNEARQPATKRK